MTLPRRTGLPLLPRTMPKQWLHDLEGVRAMGYYNGTDLNYILHGSNFATSDSWFAPIMSRTQLNRMYLIAATSPGLPIRSVEGAPPRSAQVPPTMASISS